MFGSWAIAFGPGAATFWHGAVTFGRGAATFSVCVLVGVVGPKLGVSGGESIVVFPGRGARVPLFA